MSRSEARLYVTSSPPRKIWPRVGSSRPAIMRSVVVLPQPEGPSRQKNSPSFTLNVESFTATKSANALCRFSTRISAIWTARSARKLRDDREQGDADERRHERPGVEDERERLQHHGDAERDDERRRHLERTAAEPPRPAGVAVDDDRRRLFVDPHLRTAPKVMPRSRCFLSSTVKTRIGTRKSVVPAATAGQSWPPSPMMIGMKGGAVCASPLVSSTANAYSFQAKIRQKIAVATMPVAACGSTTLRNACSRV